MPAPRARSSTEISCSERSSSSRSAVARMACSRSSPVVRRARRPRLGADSGRGGRGHAPILQGVDCDQRHVYVTQHTVDNLRNDGSRDRTRRQGPRDTGGTGYPVARAAGGARGRADHRRGPLGHRRREPPARALLRARPSRSSRRATRSAARGTSSVIPASAPTPTCSRSGTRFRPWQEAKAIADGPSIRNYIRDTARDNDIEQHIRFHHRVVRADWSSADARWTVEAERTDTQRDRAPHMRLPVRLHRLLPLRRGLHARLRGTRALPGRRSSTRSTGPRTSTTRASAWSSSAAAQPP